MSAPSSPTQDNEKMDTAVQASLSLPATPLGKGLDNAFANSAGIFVSRYPFTSHKSLQAIVCSIRKWACRCIALKVVPSISLFLITCQ